MNWIDRFLRSPRKLPLALLFVPLLVLAGCDSISRELEERAEAVKQQVSDHLPALLEESKTRFAEVQGREDWDFFAPYSNREKWEESLIEAGNELARAAAIVEKELQPLLDIDEAEQNEAVQTQLDRLDSILETVRTKAREPGERMKFLTTAKDNAEKWMATARSEVEAVNSLMSALRPVVESTKQDFPSRVSDIDAMFVSFVNRHASVEEALAAAEAEFALHEAEQNADYAVLGDSTKLITATLGKLRSDDVDLRGKLGQLSQSYSTILADMRVEYWVTPRQETWCDWTDCWGHTNEFEPRKVSGEIFNGLINSNPDDLTDAQVRSLGLDPNYDQGFGRDGRAWWLHDWEVLYFHKYIEVTGAERVETEWEEVDEEDFLDYQDALGMTIVSKPYGKFEDEEIDEPTPPGMELVGNQRYGQWEGSGQNRHWSFFETYGYYHFLFGETRHSYRYNDWEDYAGYRQRRTADSWGYYGRQGQPTRYGTFGDRTRTSSRYSNTTFAKTGGFQAADASGRGGSRGGGGPSGRGK